MPESVHENVLFKSKYQMICTLNGRLHADWAKFKPTVVFSCFSASKRYCTEQRASHCSLMLWLLIGVIVQAVMQGGDIRKVCKYPNDWRKYTEGAYWKDAPAEGGGPQQEVAWKVEHEQLVQWSVQPQIRFPLVSWCSRVCMCWSLHVSECVSESCSNRRVREDSLIQLSSVDSITNPLHLLKQPPPKNTSLPLFYVPALGAPGARLHLCLRLHTSYRPWPGSAPPTPSCATHINRRKNK